MIYKIFIIFIIIIIYFVSIFYIKESFIAVNDIPLDATKGPPSNIKYQVPVPQNQLTDKHLQEIDSDLLRNVRILKTFSIMDELDFYQMYNILKKFKLFTPTFIYNQHEKQNNTNAINLKLFLRLKLELISILNHLVIQHNYYLPYHKYQFFKIINSNVITYTNHLTPKEDNYIFTITVAREFKYQQFVIYFDIILTTQNDLYNIKINNIELIGLPIPASIEFNNNHSKTVINSPKNIIDLVEYKQQTKNNIIEEPQRISENMFKSKPFFDAKLINGLENNDMPLNTDQYIMKIAKDKQLKNHRCYGLINGINTELVEYNNPTYCESYHPEIKQVGIWDAPCQINNDCPFYQANKNYPNEFGKCNKNTGKCELPMGVIPIGFTKYGKTEPQCYNCNSHFLSNKCCREQYENIKNNVVNYKTPDYIFIGDEQLRKQYTSILEKNGLNSNPSI